MKKIFLRYNSKCADTGKILKRGNFAYYNSETKKIYFLDSIKVKEYFETENVKGYIEAQENAYFDKFVNFNYYENR